MSLERTYYDIYFQDSTHYAEAYINSRGAVAYKSIKGLPTLDQIKQHIDGTGPALGAYTVSPGNTVRWMSWDIDSKIGIEKAREFAKKISDFLTEKNIPHVLSFSGGKGYHGDIFFRNKEDAQRAKEAGEELRELLGMPKSGLLHVEVFPKQGQVDGDKKLGNLMRLPLGRHPLTGNQSVFVNTTDWESKPLDPEKVFEQRANLEDLEEALEGISDIDRMAGLLIPFWEDGQRHDVTLYTAGMCAMNGLSKVDAEELVQTIHTAVPQGELNDQLKAVESTYEKYANGETIAGENGLATFIPARTLIALRKLMGSNAATLILQSIDAIRLEKNAPFVKVRNAAHAAVTYMIENGKLVRDDLSNTYWLNYFDHHLTEVDSYHWTRLMHNLMGLNMQEAFGRQVAESIRHKAYERAGIVTVKRRSHFDKENFMLYINGGGPEIYILDGEEIKLAYNGEVDVLFKNSDDTMVLPNLLEIDEVLDPWEMMVDDVNFKEGDLTANQQKELVKAMICAMFFPEIMPTRPIMMFMGDAGSGKTTTARRILWCMEGTKEDVLGQVADKPDALRASMAAHRMIVLDNVEKVNVPWLPDVLNRAATGSQVEVRRLHTTNQMQKIIFNVYMVLTGTDLHYSDEALYTRILPIYLKKLDVYNSEGAMRSNIENNFNGFWKGMLIELNKVVAALKRNKDINPPSQTRLADFAVFCHKIADADFLDGDDLLKGLANLVDRQKELLKEMSPFFAIVDGLIKTRPDEMGSYMTLSEFYTRSQRYASQNKQPFNWPNPLALSSHIRMLEANLIKFYGMMTKTDRENGRDVTRYKFNTGTNHAQAQKNLSN